MPPKSAIKKRKVEPLNVQPKADVKLAKPTIRQSKLLADSPSSTKKQTRAHDDSLERLLTQSLKPCAQHVETTFQATLETLRSHGSKLAEDITTEISTIKDNYENSCNENLTNIQALATALQVKERVLSEANGSLEKCKCEISTISPMHQIDKIIEASLASFKVKVGSLST
jgi:F0F1-type ATP synthase membrane subunit b/b'